MKRSLNKYNDGGKVKPIVVNNPNDSRLKAYNDSLFVYNKYKDKEEWKGGKNVLKFQIPEEKDEYNRLDNLIKNSEKKQWAEEDSLWADSNFKKLSEKQQLQKLKTIADKYTNSKDYQDMVARLQYLNTSNTVREKAKFTPKWFGNKNFTEKGLKPISWDKQEQNIVSGNFNTVQNRYGTVIDKNSPIINNQTQKVVKYSPNFQEPIQPVIYNPVTKKTATAEQIKPLYKTPQLTIPERLELSMNKPDVIQSAEGPTFKQGRKFMRENGVNKNTQNFNKLPGWYGEGGTINNMKKRTLKKYSNAGTVASTGATVSPNVVGTGIGFGAEMVGALIPEKQYTDNEGNDLGSRKSIGESTLEYGAKGAAISAMLGGADFGASAVIGAGYGAVKGWMDKNEMDAAQKEANFKIDQRNMSRRMNTNTNWGNPSLNTSTNMMFAQGGILLNQDDPNANVELELQETFQMPDGTVGQVDGPDHSQGGIKVNLPEATRIWSDKLKHNGKTFAKHTKPITSKIAKLEKEIAKNPNNVAKQNSVALLNDQLDYYFNVQEANKQEKEMKRTFRKGGLVKYRVGGPFEPDEKYVTGYGTPIQNEEVIYDENMFPIGEMPKSLKPTNIYNQNSAVSKNPYRSFYETDANIPKGQPIESTASAGMDNLGFTPETPSSNWLKDNSGLVGQLGTAALSAGIQSSRINKLARPKTLNSVRLTDKVANPDYVDYSAERNAIDRTALNAMSDAQRGFGSSAATQAFKNKARLNQLEGTGRSFQAQSNANTGIKNQFLSARSEAAMREAMMNNEIDKYNLENIYGFDTMKAGQKNAITAMLSNTAGQAFGKQTEYANQLDQANILANMSDRTVLRDTIRGNKELADAMLKAGKITQDQYNEALNIKMNGGTIKKRSLRK